MESGSTSIPPLLPPPPFCAYAEGIANAAPIAKMRAFLFILRCLRWFLYVEYQTLTRNGGSVSGGVPNVKEKEAQKATLWRACDNQKGAFRRPFLPCGISGLRRL